MVSQLPKEIGWTGITVADDGDDAEPITLPPPGWFCRAIPRFFNQPNFQDASVRPMRIDPGFRAWTDDFSNIVQITTGLAGLVLRRPIQ